VVASGSSRKPAFRLKAKATLHIGLPLAIVFLFFCSSSLTGQVRPVYSLGAAGLSQVLERLQTTASALHTGAHPDDEDSAFIARLARGDNARVAYLSLNRGEGGQNIIGTELFEALGVIRTEELLQARRLDGGEQFFTRAFDFGYSKARAEAASKWDERIILDDMVRVIRTFRPLVIYSRFSGTPADGHGQHQLAGYLTPIAFKAAADPAEFPEQIAQGLRPWQARKLYRGVGFRPDPANPPTLEVETGVFDPVLGRYYAEIANEGRSQHKSQEMGVIETRGPQRSGLIRLDAPHMIERSVFDGIDTSILGLAALAGLPEGALASELQAVAAHATRALAEYDARTPEALVPVLARGLNATRDARAALKRVAAARDDARAEADFLLSFKERDFSDALARAAEIVVDPLADAETVVPGGAVTVTVRTFMPEDSVVKVTSAKVKAPGGWTVQPGGAEAEDDSNPFARFFREYPSHSVRYRLVAPTNAALTQPYFLEQPRDEARYRWPDRAGGADNDSRALPFAPPLLTADVTLDAAGTRVLISRPVQYRFADRVRGELRRYINVVPPVSVGLDSRLLIVPTGTEPDQQRVVVRVTNHLPGAATGTLRLSLPEGWTSAPTAASFTVKAQGEKMSAPFLVTAPAGRAAGAFEVRAVARVNGQDYTHDLQEIAYPHIQTHRLYSPARATAQVLDLKVAPVSVGYVMGSGDQVPDMIRRMGVTVTLIDDEMLATGDLSRFDTIVVGVRASEARPAFVANNGRLLAYAERGGTLIVQYQQNDYVARSLSPYPAQMNSRVTDERAPVKILAPTHPVFTFPNSITAADFGGWVQERNLYAFTTFDNQYRPLLETADPGEPPQLGGEVYARVGKGHYVYTAYAWFRQLPAGVPGAYRQFANLISLSKGSF
jgi:LmbE family N-acetylglucosaminyl deacetylase